jgi:hypothetical protein
MWLVLGCVTSAPQAAPVPVAPVLADPVPTSPPPAPALEPLPAGAFRREIAPGLVVAAYDPPEIHPADYAVAEAGALDGTDQRLFVVTIDLDRYQLRYLSSRDRTRNTERTSADVWADRHDLAVAWNPGMFEPDGRATGYTRDGAFHGQDQVRKGSLYRAWFVVAGTSAAVVDQIPSSGGWSALPETLRTKLDAASFVTQSLPILRDGAPAYPPRKNLWSELCFGADRDGNVVVVFSRWPYEMRELGARIAALDLGIVGLVHGEGGPEATLVVRAPGLEWVWVGSYETGFSDDGNTSAWSLPAILGARPR